MILDDLRSLLSTVLDPERQRDVVSLNMVKNISFYEGQVRVAIDLPAGHSMKDELQKRIENTLRTNKAVQQVDVDWVPSSASIEPVSRKNDLPGVKTIIAVYACKGGVGKSTVAANLAVALAQSGAKTGLLDADVHGPNVPLMMGVDAKPFVSETNRITPLMNYGVKVMSLGLLKDSKLPFIWRGPMVHGAVQQLLRDTDWGNLDYLIIDCPPGTGDAQLTVSQSVSLTGVVIVSTPQKVCHADGVKGINMFRKLNVPLLGLVENMSGFICEHCHHETAIFSKGGGVAEAAEFGIPFLGAIPLDPAIVVGGDNGKPIVASHPDSVPAKAFVSIMKNLLKHIPISSSPNVVIGDPR